MVYGFSRGAGQAAPLHGALSWRTDRARYGVGAAGLGILAAKRACANCGGADRVLCKAAHSGLAEGKRAIGSAPLAYTSSESSLCGRPERSQAASGALRRAASSSFSRDRACCGWRHCHSRRGPARNSSLPLPAPRPAIASVHRLAVVVLRERCLHHGLPSPAISRSVRLWAATRS